MEKYLYSSVPSCPYCCSYCLVISSTKYRTLEKLTIIVCQVYNFSRNLTCFRRNLLSDLVSSYVKYAEENNTDKICLVNSTFIAKNTPEKYFQTYEAQETWIENNQLRKGKFHLTSLMDGGWEESLDVAYHNFTGALVQLKASSECCFSGPAH